ncbi:hypothetical protein MTO96_038520 [Rhipicephalus appendiculatus]
MGQRSCPGETLATVEIFLGLTSLLQRFRVLPAGKMPFDINSPSIMSAHVQHLKLRFLDRGHVFLSRSTGGDCPGGIDTVDPWAWPSNRGRALAQVARNAGNSRSRRGANRAANGSRDDQESSMSSASCGPARPSTTTPACLPAMPFIEAAVQTSSMAITPSLSRHRPRISCTRLPRRQSHHPTAVGMSNATSVGPARPQRTHSERSQRTSRMSLYRSNSSLDLDHNNGSGNAVGEPGALRGGPSRRDYGSASSLDLLAASSGGDSSFFALLREYRATGQRREDQRRSVLAVVKVFSESVNK